MRPRLRYAVLTFLIASVPIVLMLLATRGSAERPAQPVLQTLAYGAAEWYPWALVAPLIDRLVRRSSRRRADRLRAISAHVALALLFLVAHSFLMFVVNGTLLEGEWRPFSTMLLGDMMPTAILYCAIAAGFTITETRRRQTEVAERLRAEVAEARLDALRQQLNPHFLFNTLNHIVSELRSLRSRDVEPALRMLLALSDLLRDVLRERAQLIPLRDEVRMVERYLEIERARFGERLQAEVTLEPRALDAQVPSLLLQPLLENAMKHGVSQADGICRLALTVRVQDDRLNITVRDGGPGLHQAGGSSPASSAQGTTGVGLKNTSERLRYLYGDDHDLRLSTLDGGGLLVAIDLPFRR
jgi:two-component system LytT family sensor kinase